MNRELTKNAFIPSCYEKYIASSEHLVFLVGSAARVPCDVGTSCSTEAGDAMLPDFEGQCQTMLMLAPRVISSIMRLYAPAFVSELKARGILWFANATTVAEAKSC